MPGTRKLVAVLFSDVVGYTALTQRDEETARRVVRRHGEIVGALSRACRGTVRAERGDELLVTFESALDAVDCALGIQASAQKEADLSLRIGIHLGDVVFEGTHLHGDGVNVASRIRPLAEPGQTCVSGEVMRATRGHPHLTFRDLGEQELRNVAEPVAVYVVEGDAPDLPEVAETRATWSGAGFAEKFVGRVHELGELEKGLGGALEGRGCLSLLVGEAGIGKTRLAEVVSAQAAGRGSRVAWGRGWEGGGAPAFWPWVQILRACLVEEDGAEALPKDAHLAQVAELVPEIRDGIPGLPEVRISPDPEQARFARFDAIVTILTRMSRERPLVLVLDDLQWADRASLELLELFASSLREAAIFVIGTIREPAAGETSLDADLSARLYRLGSPIGLRGLSEAEVGSFVEDRGGATPLESFVAALHSATNGNPFFVSEVLRVVAAESPERQLEHAMSESFPIPESVRAAIRKRIARLPEVTRSILSAGAAAGRDLDPRVLARSCEVGASDALGELGRAEEAGLVVRHPSTPAMFTFTHGLVRETLYEALSPSLRADLHRRIGYAVEALHGDLAEPPLAALAHHFAEAAAGGYESGNAIDYSKRAATRARELLAWEDAIAHFERTLALLDSTGASDDRTRYECLIGLGEVLWFVRDYDRAVDRCRDAALVAERLGEPGDLARAVVAMGSPWLDFHPASGLRDWVPLLEKTLAMLPETDGAMRAAVMARLARSLEMLGGDRERTLALAVEAKALVRDLRDDMIRADVLRRVLLITWGPDNLDERIALAGEILELAERNDHRGFAAYTLLMRSMYLREAGRGDEARRDVELAKSMTKGLHDPYLRGYLLFTSSCWAIVEGRFEEAESLIEQAVASSRPGSYMTDVVPPAQTLFVRWERGGLEDLLPLFEAQGTAYPGVVLPSLGALAAWLYAEVGRAAEARRSLDSVARDGFELVPRGFIWLEVIWFAAESVTLLDDKDRAETLYDLLEPYAERCAGNPIPIGSLARSLANLAVVLRRFDDAERHFATALDVHERMGFPTWIARTKHDQARMLVARNGPGDRKRALELLDEALAVARELGMKMLEERAHALQEQLGCADEAGHQAEIRRTTGGWTIRYEDVSFVLPESKGLSYLSYLLVRPGTELHVADLVATVEGVPGDGASSRADLGHGGEILDPRARSEYRARLEDLESELEEATANTDVGRAERIRGEIEFLRGELSAAYGLGGRARRGGDVAERVRKAVGNRIRAAITQIDKHAPTLAEHLRTSVRMGKFCVYEPGAPVRWIGSD